jgi:transcription initiation factor TFIID TATA-box-binding protein
MPPEAEWVRTATKAIVPSAQHPPPRRQFGRPQDDAALRAAAEAAAAARSNRTPAGGRFHIQNVVATIDLGKHFDLVQLVARLMTRGAGAGDHNKSRFAACKIRVLSPKTTSLVFSSGNVVITGAKTEYNALLSAYKCVHIIRRAGYTVSLQDFTVRNIVGSSNYGFKIDINRLHIDHSLYASYSPDLFPGCVYRLVEPRLVFLIFDSGNVIITGAPTRECSNEGHRICTEIVAQYRQDGGDPQARMRAADAARAIDLTYVRGGGGTPALMGASGNKRKRASSAADDALAATSMQMLRAVEALRGKVHAPISVLAAPDTPDTPDAPDAQSGPPSGSGGIGTPPTGDPQTPQNGQNAPTGIWIEQVSDGDDGDDGDDDDGDGSGGSSGDDDDDTCKVHDRLLRRAQKRAKTALG